MPENTTSTMKTYRVERLRNERRAVSYDVEVPVDVDLLALVRRDPDAVDEYVLAGDQRGDRLADIDEANENVALFIETPDGQEYGPFDLPSSTAVSSTTPSATEGVDAAAVEALIQRARGWVEDRAEVVTAEERGDSHAEDALRYDDDDTAADLVGELLAALVNVRADVERDRADALARYLVADAETLAGRALTDAERQRIRTGLDNSTMGEAFAEVVAAVTDA